MPARSWKLVCLISLITAVSCSSLLDPLTSEQLAEATELARERALAFEGLDPASREMVATNKPKVGIYRLAAHFEQYSFAWKISANRSVSVFGEGDLRKLERAKVAIVK